jgi:hypothetical protein
MSWLSLSVDKKALEQASESKGLGLYSGFSTTSSSIVINTGRQMPRDWLVDWNKTASVGRQVVSVIYATYCS